MGVSAGIAILAYTIIADAPIETGLMAITTGFGSKFPDIDHSQTKLGKAASAVTDFTKIMLGICIVLFLYASYKDGTDTLVLNGIYFLAFGILIYLFTQNKVIKRELNFITEHRGIMHTLVPPVMIIAPTFWSTEQVYIFLSYGLALGMVVHYLGDLCTYDGVPLLYPFTKEPRNILKIRSTTKKGQAALDTLSDLFSILFIALGVLLGLYEKGVILSGVNFFWK